MKDKLSREEKLIGWLDRQIVFIKRMLNEFPQKAKGHLAWTDFDEQNASQIKSLLTPVPEDKLDELVGRMAMVWGYSSERQKKVVDGYVRHILKAYDNLREGKEG